MAQRFFAEIACPVPTPRKLKPTTCCICNHQERERIEALRAAGASLENLSRRFAVSRDSFWRHWSAHVSTDTKLAYLAGPSSIAELKEKAMKEGGSVLDYLTILRSFLMAALSTAAKVQSPHALAVVSGRLIETLKEIGKLTGEIEQLSAPGVTVTRNIAVMADQRMIELQSGLLAIARSHPGARQDIIALLRGLDERPRPNGAHAPAMIEGEAVNVA
jgi:hypothetical protein